MCGKKLIIQAWLYYATEFRSSGLRQCTRVSDIAFSDEFGKSVAYIEL